MIEKGRHFEAVEKLKGKKYNGKNVICSLLNDDRFTHGQFLRVYIYEWWYIIPYWTIIADIYFREIHVYTTESAIFMDEIFPDEHIRCVVQ